MNFMYFYVYCRLHPQNALGVRNFADTLGCSLLVQAADKFIQHHFAEVSVTAEYLALELKDVSELVSSDQLHVATEETVSAFNFFTHVLKIVKTVLS
jgi:kelch-like protein 18